MQLFSEKKLLSEGKTAAGRYHRSRWRAPSRRIDCALFDTGISSFSLPDRFVHQIPVFLISPVGGYFADRWNRHRIILFTQTASIAVALTLAWLTLTHRIQIWQFLVEMVYLAQSARQLLVKSAAAY